MNASPQAKPARHPRLLFISGKGPPQDGVRPKGKLGADMSLEDGYKHARQVGLLLISAMKEVLGDLDRVQSIIKVFGLVNATPDYVDHFKVINGKPLSPYGHDAARVAITQRDCYVRKPCTLYQWGVPRRRRAGHTAGGQSGQPGGPGPVADGY